MLKVKHGIALGALGCLLLTGCATAPRRPAGDTEVSQSQEERLAVAHAHYAQGMIYDLNEDPDKAIEEYSRAALADPANETLVLELARRYFQTQQVEKAVDLLTRAAAVPGASSRIFALLGEAYSREGKYARAIAATRAAIKLDPKFLPGYQNLFVIGLQRNRPREALQALDDAAKVPGVGPDFLVELGALYAGLPLQAPDLKSLATTNGLAVLKRADSANLAPQLAIRLGDTYNLLGDSTNAARIYENLLAKYGDLPALRDSLHAKLAEIYLRGGESKKAADELQAILLNNPGNPQTYYFLGTVAYEAQQFTNAVDYFRKTLLLDEDNEQAYYDLASAETALDRTQDALSTLERAVAKFDTNFFSEFYTARVDMKAKDFTNAVTHFSRAESLARTSITNRLNGYFYFEAGAASERKGDFEQATRYFEQSLKLSPDMPEALNYYGYMLADRGEKLDKARGMIEKAVRLEPQNAAYVDSLGWVLFKLGKTQDGLAQIQKAIELSDKEPDATLYEHLGDIYAALKQSDKAREAWQKSVALEPSPSVQKKLDQAAGH